MTNYYKEKMIVLPFLIKCDETGISTEKKIEALINLIDINTLRFIIKLNLDQKGTEDFKKVVDFVKINKVDIINQLKKQNLFYSRINFAFALPAFSVSGAILLGGVMHCACPALALVIALLAGMAAIFSCIATFSTIHTNLQKIELYNAIESLSSVETNRNRFFSSDSDPVLSIASVMTMCQLPTILGMDPA